MPEGPGLEPAFSLDIELAGAVDLGARPEGRRWWIQILGGRVSGALSGEILSGGGDFATERGDGCWDLDARYAVRLDDGTPIEVRNVGCYVEGEKGPLYYLTTPRFRVGGSGTDPRPAEQHRWLERRVFVGKAHELDEHAIRIDVFAVVEGRS